MQILSLIKFSRHFDWRVIPILCFRLAAVLFHFVVSVLIVRGLGAGEAGEYLTAYALVMIVGVLCRCGSENAIVIVVSELAGESNSAKVGSHVLLVLCGVLICTLLWLAFSLLAVCVALSLGWKSDGSEGLYNTTSVLCFGLIFYNVMIVFAQSFLGKQRQILNILYINIFWMSIFVLLNNIFRPATATGMAWMFNASVIVVSIVSAVHWFAVEGWPRKIVISYGNRILSVCRNLFVAEISVQLFLWAPVILIGFFLTSTDVTNYTIATRVASVSIVVTQAMNAYMAPKFSWAVNNMSTVETKSLYFKATCFVVLLSIPVVSTLFIWAHEFVAFYDVNAEPASSYLRILLVGQIFSIFSGTATIFLIMSGGDERYKTASVLNVLIGVGLSLLLCNFYQVYGVVFSIVVASFFNCILLLIFRRQILAAKIATGF